ncbi:MAG: PQQ-binding-like beta-propeller repeat protein [Pirellulales bacterium]|nr:PQQ-binding-like beta-propeller repeat protein [Pirellulales bacterium]
MKQTAFATLAVFSLLVNVAAPLAAEELPPDLGTRPEGIDWPDFLGPRRDARSPEKGLSDDLAGRPPRVVWQCELGESYSSPSISRGRLFHFDRHGDQHRLTCRRSETGEELWRHELAADFTDMLGYNNGPRATPVADGGRVYVMSPEGRLHCVRIADGKKQWAIDTQRQFGVVKNFFGVGSTPIVWGDLLIANIGGSPAGSPPDVYAAGGRVVGNGTGVVAFDKLTGAIRWQATDELASYASPVIAPLGNAGQPWCFVFARGGLLGFDPASGAQRFHFPWRAAKLESVNASSPVVVGDEVFISESYGPGSALVRVKPDGPQSPGAADAPPSPAGDDSDADDDYGAGPAGGAESASKTASPGAKTSPLADLSASSHAYEVVWKDDPRRREKAMELHWNTAVFHEGHLYGSSGQHGGAAELRCIEWATGQVRWSERGLTRSSLLYVDGRFVCLSEDGALRLLRATPERYEELADITPRDEQGEPLLTYPAWPAPVLSHGLLYVRGGKRLVCLELFEPQAD